MRHEDLCACDNIEHDFNVYAIAVAIFFEAPSKIAISLQKPYKLAMAECKFQLQLTVKMKDCMKPMFIPHVLIDGVPFIKFHKRCNVLANLCNQIKDNKYFQGVDVFQYLIKMRNDEVNNLIEKAMQADDPLAEVPFKAAYLNAKGRLDNFRKFKIPETIIISIPSFVLGETPVEAVSLRVLATPKVCASAEVEASTPNIKWLAKACLFQWMPEESSSPDKRAIDSSWILPSKIKVAKDNDKILQLVAYWKQPNGRWTRKSMHVKKAEYETDEDLQDQVRKVIDRIERFLEENHCDDDDDEHDNDEGDKAAVGGDHEMGGDHECSELAHEK